MDNKLIFISACIIIGTIYIFKNKNIQLNAFMGLFIGLGIVAYLWTKFQTTKKIESDKNKEILSEIHHPIGRIDEYQEFIDFFYWIQDLYNYNPPAFEELISTINNFLLSYEEGILSDSGKRYNLMTGYKTHAINTLNSFIYTIPLNTTYRIKLFKSMQRLDGILQPYLDEVDKKNNETNNKKLNNMSVFVIKNVKPENFYDEEFDVY